MPSPYAYELAHARLDALRQLIEALNSANSPAEKRRCAVAIFNAPPPSDLDEATHTPGMSESIGGASESRGYASPTTPHPVPRSAAAPSSRPGPVAPPPPQLTTQSLPTLTDLARLTEELSADDDPCAGLSDDEILARANALLQTLRPYAHSP